MKYNKLKKLSKLKKIKNFNLIDFATPIVPLNILPMEDSIIDIF